MSGAPEPAAAPPQTPALGLPPAHPPTPLSVLILATVLACLPMFLLSQVAAHWRVDVVDDQMFGYFGWRMAHGGTVYLDVWDNKPPGIYWVNQLGFLLTDGYSGVVALCALAVIAAHVCFFVIAASVYFRGTAAIATVLASFFMTHIYFQGGTNRTETFLIAFELAAVAVYLRGWARPTAWKWLVAGLLCGCAFLFKQVGLAAWAAMGLHLILLVVTRELPWREGLRRCLLLAAGVAAVVLAAAAALAAQGALAEAFRATFTFNRAYFATGRSSFTNTWVNRHMLVQHLYPILLLPILLAIAAAVHAFLWWLRPLFRPHDVQARLRESRSVCPRCMLLFGIWGLVAFYGAQVSPHYFRHYLVPVLPPLLLFGAYILNVIKTELGLLRRLAQRGWVTALFVAMGYFAWGAFIRQKEAAAVVWWTRQPQLVEGRWTWKPSPWEELGEHIAALTRPDETIYCWGYLPGAYLWSQRIATVRYFTNEKIGQIKQHPEVDAIREEIRGALESTPPAVFVLSVTDYLWITNDFPDLPPDEFGLWLGAWLTRNYHLVEELVFGDESFYVLERNGHQRPAPPGDRATCAAAPTD